jgi:hypothetical protein
MIEFERAERLSLKAHPELNEKWIQELIAKDPTILGLGDLELRQKEHIQPHAGRLEPPKCAGAHLIHINADPDSIRSWTAMWWSWKPKAWGGSRYRCATISSGPGHARRDWNVTAGSCRR